MTIRNMIKGEELPETLRTGFETGSMPEWIWVAERDGKIVALLIAAPAHIAAILLRVLTTEEANPNDLRALLVKAMHDIKERGFKAYMTWLDPTRSEEAALMSVVLAAKGFKGSTNQVFCYGRT